MKKLVLLAWLAIALLGCTDDPPRGLRLAVFRYNVAGSCWEQIWADTGASTAGVDVCEANETSDGGAGGAGGATPNQSTSCVAGCDLVAGSDRLAVAIDYGDDVPFDPGTAPSRPELTVLVGGEAVTSSRTWKEPTDTRAVFVASFLLPAQPIGELKILAKAAEGFERETAADANLRVVPAPVSVSLGECDAVDCTIYGGIGKLPVTVMAPGRQPQTVTLTWTINGVVSTLPLILSREIESDVSGGIYAVGDISIPAPAVVVPTDWTITAHLGLTSAVARSVNVAPAAPQVTIDECASGPCDIVANDRNVVTLKPTALGPTGQTAAVTVSVDGIAQPGSQPVVLDTPAKITLDGKEYDAATASYAAVLPETAPGASVRFTVRVGSEVAQSAELHMVYAQPTLSVDGCDGQSECVMVAHTGAAVVRPAAVGPVGQTVSLSSYLNGVLQPGTRSITLNAPAEIGDLGAATAVEFVPVPIAPEGSRWRLEIRTGALVESSPEIRLVAPQIQASLSCGNTCSLAPGDPVDVLVTAPMLIGTKQALITTTVDGLTDLVSVVLNLNQLNTGGQVVFEQKRLTVPDASGSTWTIDVSLAGYRATTLIVPIQ